MQQIIINKYLKSFKRSRGKCGKKVEENKINEYLFNKQIITYTSKETTTNLSIKERKK